MASSTNSTDVLVVCKTYANESRLPQSCTALLRFSTCIHVLIALCLGMLKYGHCIFSPPHMSDTLDPSRSPDLPEPIGSVGVVASLHKVPNGYQVVAQTTDGGDADLWKDGLFKSKVTRYLCFTRKNQDSVVVDMKFIDLRDAMPMGFTPVLETLDTKEPALRKRRLCVKICPRASAQTVLYDIQVMGRSKLPRTRYTCIGELNNMSIWYSAGDLPPTQRGLPSVANKTKTSTASYQRCNQATL
ncbi:multivesicular body subunit 12Bb isoform X2 [Gadus macrocephalus]|uniref:multivesicular body subunit 12Bb isoform X2 n=1 Tax=Gadus macrocephalus TaxID=80720 RepID=UPI0028CB1CCA|nr:multivesicular body subunit 12Bb isoform X2 [Gadus macrocephalus]